MEHIPSQQLFHTQYISHDDWAFIDKGVVAIDPTCINIGRLERTESNIIHFKWVSQVDRHSQ